VKKRTPDTDRPGDRGAVQSGPNLFSIYGPVAFQLALGGEERDRTDVLSFFVPVGVFLLMAARRPSEHRSMIALAAWWNISHGAVTAIQTVEAWVHSVHRNFTDVIVSLVIGVALLALLSAKTSFTPHISGSVQAVSVKYIIFRSVSDSSVPSRSASRTIWAMRYSFASRPELKVRTIDSNRG
jgi:hypothetical protein